MLSLWQLKTMILKLFRCIDCFSVYNIITFSSRRKCAVVTGGNKGISLEICRQLASQGITVVLTARDEQRGTAAVDNLVKNEHSLAHLLVFHRLDVTDPQTIASLADFVTTRFGKLDILVNNAGINGVVMNSDALARAVQQCGGWPSAEANWNEIATETYEMGAECLETNYYGTKRVVEALTPLLHLSDSPKIVNVSSALGLLQNIPSEWARGILGDEENLCEEKVDQVLNAFLEDHKEGMLESKGWPLHLSPYILSKASMNAYTRILAKKYPSFCINSVCPGFVQTDITCNTGLFTANQGADMPVRLALLPHGWPSGLFYLNKQVSSF